jgi:nucleoside permease NupC
MSTLGPTTGKAWTEGVRVMQRTRTIATMKVCAFKNFPSLAHLIGFLIALPMPNITERIQNLTGE